MQFRCAPQLQSAKSDLGSSRKCPGDSSVQQGGKAPAGFTPLNRQIHEIVRCAGQEGVFGGLEGV